MQTSLQFSSMGLYKYALMLFILTATYGRGSFLSAQTVPAQTVEKGSTIANPSLKAFEGKYHLQLEPGKDFYLQITAKQNRLVLEESWSGNVIEFEQQSALEFYNQERSFPLKFIKDQTGAIHQVLAFDKDLWTRVKE